MAKPRRAIINTAIFVVVSLVNGTTIPYETRLESNCFNYRPSGQRQKARLLVVTFRQVLNMTSKSRLDSGFLALPEVMPD